MNSVKSKWVINSELDGVLYTNADCGGCLDTHHSTSGYHVFFDDYLISWLMLFYASIYLIQI